MIDLIRRVGPLSLILLLCITLQGEEADVSSSRQAKQALERLNGLIGQWRGTGQVRRGSTRGAWRQNGEFVWDFSNSNPAIRYDVTDGKLTNRGLITWSPDKSYELYLESPEDEKRILSGKWDSTKLVFESPETDEIRYRVTLTPLNEKRTLVLHEKTSPGGQSFFRIAEVGYTRAGTRLALPGGGQRECVVTGGTAQTAVTYNGETYYVCCSGCKQAFDDDPAGIIAEYQTRLKKKLESDGQ